VAWIVKLVSIGAEGEKHSTDVMRIAKPDDLTDLASLGLTLAEGKRSWCINRGPWLRQSLGREYGVSSTTGRSSSAAA